MSDEKRWTRKELLVAGGAAVAMIASQKWARFAFASPESSNEIFVLVFLRGGSDGLSLVPPIAGPNRAIYEAERPSLKIPLSGPKAALPLTAELGLHPAAKPLHELFQSGKLAVVHAAGLSSHTRSHFDAQNFMELGTPDKKNTAEGWLTRHLLSRHSGPKPMDALAVGSLLPTVLLAEPRSVVLNNPGGFNLGGKKEIEEAQRKALARMYGSGDSWLHRYGIETLKAIDWIESAHTGEYQPLAAANYPHGEIGNRMKVAAQMIKEGPGLDTIAIDMGGWDTHKFQGANAEGHFADLVGQLSESLAAFYNDLQGPAGYSGRLTVVVMTEFGRRLKENANHGTDHGHGGVMLVLGDHVHGGKVHGKFPGLKSEELYERADLAVTTDFRQVLSEVLTTRLKNPRVEHVFPGYAGYKALGVCKV